MGWLISYKVEISLLENHLYAPENTVTDPEPDTSTPPDDQIFLFGADYKNGDLYLTKKNRCVTI